MRKLTPIFILILIGAVYFGVRSYLPQSQPIGINQVTVPSPSPYVALTFEPYFDTKAANTPTKLGVTVSLSPEYQLKTARLEISYSPNCLTPTLTQGDALSRVLRAPQIGGGLIKLTYSLASNNDPVSDYAIIAYVTTGPKAGGDCNLTFTKNTAILGPGSSDNILTSTTPALIKLKTSGPSIPPFKQPDYIRDR